MRLARAIAALALTPLAACGFAPVYAPTATNAPSADLAQVYVAIIPNRSGQELREALRQRLEGATGPRTPHYTLSVAYALTSQGIGIQPDTSVTFMRYHGQATWRLLTANPAAPALTSGVATAEDGYSLIVNQYFYDSLAQAAVTKRMADTLADQISVRLAAWFRARGRSAKK